MSCGNLTVFTDRWRVICIWLHGELGSFQGCPGVERSAVVVEEGHMILGGLERATVVVDSDSEGAERYMI